MKELKRSVIFTAISMFAIAFVLSSATFAWFSSNGEVSTSRVDAVVSDVDASLYISSSGGSGFNNSSSAAIVQVNEAEEQTDDDGYRLMPVSTDDLENFVYKVQGSSDTNPRYVLDSDAKRYYHGIVYLQGVCNGSSSYSRMAVYLNDIDKMIEPVDDSIFANAARIGLQLSAQNPVIIRMSEEENDTDKRINNTYLNGVLADEDQVLHYEGEGVLPSAVDDPSESMKTFSAAETNPKPLFYINLNQIYELNIYFYLEGCDPDCSDSVSLNMADIYISLFGVLEE